MIPVLKCLYLIVENYAFCFVSFVKKIQLIQYERLLEHEV